MLACQPMESTLIKAALGYDSKMVFIVGPPRSGTTLLYEAMVTRYRFGYISNVAHRLYKTPATATKLFAQCIAGWRGRFASRYGHISGWGSPNEGGWVWRRWIPEEHYLDADKTDAIPIEIIRGTFAAISQILRGPMLNKNVMHSVHMQVLDRLFPGCLYIAMHRNLVDNVRSVLHARIETNGLAQINQWLSVKPRGWERFQYAAAVDQVAFQVRLTTKHILEDASILGTERLCCLAYEDLCDHPEVTMNQVREFLAGHGITVEDRLLLPERFTLSPGRPLPVDLETQLKTITEPGIQSNAEAHPSQRRKCNVLMTLEPDERKSKRNR